MDRSSPLALLLAVALAIASTSSYAASDPYSQPQTNESAKVISPEAPRPVMAAVSTTPVAARATTAATPVPTPMRPTVLPVVRTVPARLPAAVPGTGGTAEDQDSH
jgi:hypothetical protein